ncbi:hypothetical protein BC826DRAFT_1098082 [Russula brevipes]|nr:hypothetical protein BC826DRAFT_1098082 [Russula brevipes]
MHLDHLVGRNDCVQCSSIPPVCNCGPSQVCFQIAQSCDQCSTFKCADQQTAASPSHAVSGRAVAGAVVGAVVFLVLVGVGFLWWRRRSAAAVQHPVPEVKDIPAPADTVLNRPDPTEKVVVTPAPTTAPGPAKSVVRVYGNSNTTINLDPTSESTSPRRDSSQSNPFGDSHSIQTTSTGSQSTNVIPIAFSSSASPLRGQRAPRVDLNIDHMNLSVDSVPIGSSVPSGVAGISDDRSYITNASYATDVLSEVPTIVTGRQVASAAKAAIVSASSTRSLASRPSIRSPLTASFGPQDILHEGDERHSLSVPRDPFADQRSPARSSLATQGSSQPPQDWDTTAEQHPWEASAEGNDSDRPMSTYTQAASVIGANIMDATRVHLGFGQPASASTYPATPLASSVGTGSHTLVRMASGRLVSPFTPGAKSPLRGQQETAMANAQAQAQQSEKNLVGPQRISMGTMASGMSGRADSILESFTFVPPSPISNLPPQTPHVPDHPAPVQDVGVLEPPNRRVLGMSTGSQLSSMSTGLGSFPFQIDHGSEGIQAEEPPIGVPRNGHNIEQGRQRASLDTIELTKDLTSYPLGFDRQSKESFAAFLESQV